MPLPVHLWVVGDHPRMAQDDRRVGSVYDEQKDGLLMVAGDEKSERDSGLSDATNSLAIKRVGH